MIKEKTRDEIPEEYKWDLSTIFKNDELLEKSINEVKSEINNLNFDKMMESADNLYAALENYYKIDRNLEKIYTYVARKSDEDITNTKYQGYKQLTLDLCNKFSQKISSFGPNLLKEDYQVIEKFYQENPKLKKDYEFILEKEYRYKKHTLSAEEEKLMATLGKAFADNEMLMSTLADGDLDFGQIEVNGEPFTLSEANYSSFSTSSDRTVREKAFKQLFKTYEKFNNTFALILKNHFDTLAVTSKVNKFASSREAALFADNVSEEVYDNLINVVHHNLDKLHDYYTFKKKALNLGELHLYDTSVNLINDSETKYDLNEAHNLIIDTVKVFGPDYVSVVERAFTERWIDFYPNKNKASGAYSGGSYDSNPFILTNYLGKYRDVSTLIHELGHSLHTYYSNKQPYQYSGYSIFVAEVASTVNELLLANNMLEKASNNEEKLYILNELLELFKATIYRQTMFAEFENIIASKTDKEEVLTKDEFNNIYYDLNKKYFGENVIIDEEIKYEWQRIPHFYYNFYVYKYATGLSAACYIVKNILSGKENAVDDYLKFLKTGNTMYPLDELKVAGVDLTNPEVIESAMDMFNNYLEEFEKLYNER